MRKLLYSVISIAFLALTLYSCGGGGSSGQSMGGFSSNPGYQSSSNTLAFDATSTDPSKLIVPFPNDMLLASTKDRIAPPSPVIHVPVNGVTDPATLAFYTAINKLELQGLSPNTPITIPLGTDKIQLNESQLQSNIEAIDATRLIGGIFAKLPYTPSSDQDYCYLYSQDNNNQKLAIACADTILGYYAKTNPSAIGQFVAAILPYISAPLIVKQNGNVINAYPAVPLNPDDKYIVVVTNGIDKLAPSPVAQALIGDKPLSGNLAQLEPVREAYVGLLPLVQSLGIKKSSILEMFTFSTASKTLGLQDYAQIGAAANGLIPPSSMAIQGYKYSDLDNMTYAGATSKNEYMQFDGLSDLPLVCQKLHNDNASWSPLITDNLTSWMLTPNVYSLSNIQKILVKYGFPDNQSNYPYVCTAIFDNATLYDNVTTAIYGGNTTKPSGIIMFQHGLGRDKSDAKALSSDSNFSNYLFYAMDLPWHGGRIPPNPMFNSMKDKCQVSGSCYLTSNVVNDVMNIYQSLLDMHTFEKFIRAGDTYSLPIYFIGQSMGSITGSMFLNIDNITISQVLGGTNNYISKAVLNVGGANYSAILNEAMNPEIMGLLCSALKVPKDKCTPENVAKYKDTVQYNMTVALFQLVLDPVDPEFFAHNPSIKSKVIIQSAYHDTLVPNTSNELLYNDYNTPGFPYSRFTPTDVLCDGGNPLADAGWYMFKGEAPYDWINHGFIVHTADSIDTLNKMYPSAAGHMSLECVNDAEDLAREQAADFCSP